MCRVESDNLFWAESLHAAERQKHSNDRLIVSYERFFRYATKRRFGVVIGEFSPEQKKDIGLEFDRLEAYCC